MIFSADDAALILDVADAAAHWGDYLEDQDRTEELGILDEQLLSVHVLVKRLEAEATAPARPVTIDEYVAEYVAEFGACILTAENMATEDDCTTHGHEVVSLSDVALPVDQVNVLLADAYYGHCDTCGAGADIGGCTLNPGHEIALD